MKARLLLNSIKMGHIARDDIRLVRKKRDSAVSDRPQGEGAHAVLESFEDHNRPFPDEPAVPTKRLVTFLTEGLRGTSSLTSEDGRIVGERLFKGCPVRLRGIPQRRFIVREVFWDIQEVRVRELRTNIEYVLPWDCLELAEELER